MTNEEYEYYQSGKKGGSYPFGDPIAGSYWSAGRRASEAEEEARKTSSWPSTPPQSPTTQTSTGYNAWSWSANRNSGPNLTAEEVGQAVAGLAVLAGVVLVVAIVVWLLAMIYQFRLEILTSLTGIGLACVVCRLMYDLLIERALLRKWVAVAVTVLAGLTVILLTAVEVRNLSIFHNWNGDAFNFTLPTGMLGKWGMSLLALVVVSATEIGVAWYVGAAREAQWIVASLVLSGWGASSAFFVVSWIKGLPDNTLVWCAGALWGWLAVGFLLVPLRGSAPRWAELLRNVSCALTGLPWALVLLRYLLPELEESRLGVMQTAETILWLWFGVFAVAWPVRKLAPAIWNALIIMCRALPIALWIECSTRFAWPELKELDYSTPGLVGAALCVCVGLGLIAVPLLPVSDSRRKTLFIIGYAQVPALLIVCIFRNLPAWMSAVRPASLNPWLLSMEVLGWIAVIATSAGSITLLVWALNPRATWRVAVVEVWILRALAALSWLYILAQYFPTWIVTPRGVWLWIGGSLGWLLWLAALLSMAKITALIMKWSDELRPNSQHAVHS